MGVCHQRIRGPRRWVAPAAELRLAADGIAISTIDPSADQLCLRTSAGSYVVPGILLVPMLGIWLAAAYKHPGPDAWQGPAVALAMCVAVAACFLAMRVTVSREQLTYRTIFGTRSMLLSDIAQSELKVNPGPRDVRVYLVVTSRSGQAPLRILVKPFSREQLRQLFDHPALKFVKV